MATKKFSPNAISSLLQDWGLDTDDSLKRPYSGEAVQKFLKAQIQSLTTKNSGNASNIESLTATVNDEISRAQTAESGIIAKNSEQDTNITTLFEKTATNKDSIDAINAELAEKLVSVYAWYQSVSGSDSDAVLNRWDEIVAFVTGMDGSSTLEQLIDNINTLVNAETDRARAAEASIDATLETHGSAIATNCSDIKSMKESVLYVTEDEYEALTKAGVISDSITYNVYEA